MAYGNYSEAANKIKALRAYIAPEDSSCRHINVCAVNMGQEYEAGYARDRAHQFAAALGILRERDPPIQYDFTEIVIRNERIAYGSPEHEGDEIYFDNDCDHKAKRAIANDVRTRKIQGKNIDRIGYVWFTPSVDLNIKLKDLDLSTYEWDDFEYNEGKGIWLPRENGD
ncbi:MAG: hypothetical protein ISS36_03210 [Candidatus Aenigmarchaeota archaeon]|nr:hypothetical protein [Candidatus Aenigmarchaeota archaeon]